MAPRRVCSADGSGDSFADSSVSIDTCPSAPRDSLGGDVMAVGTARLSVRLPGKKLEEANVRAHAFASAGGLQSLAQLNSDGSFFPSLRACVGVGLAIPTALGRVELNLTHVTKRRSDDAVVRSGLQRGRTVQRGGSQRVERAVN